MIRFLFNTENYTILPNRKTFFAHRLAFYKQSK